MKTVSSFALRLFQFEGTKLHPNVLLMCKLLVILMTTHHMFFKIDDPHIPFIPALDMLHDYPGVFKSVLRTIYACSVFALLFNIKVRTASIVTGIVVILSILASKPLFFNHSFICACALFLAGLTNNEDPPYLLIFQLSIVYFGASFNKFLQSDWWSGMFIDTWLRLGRENPVYITIADLFPDLVLAKVLSYIAMFTEFAISILILFKRTRNLTLWFIIIFHTTLFTLTSFRFGHFIESLAIVLLAFLNMPKKTMLISYQKKGLETIKRLFSILDRDHKQVWNPISQKDTYWLKVETEKGILYDHKALRDIILYTPNFFMILLFIDMGLYVLLGNFEQFMFICNAIVIWAVIIYFIPKPSIINRSQLQRR
ncbi:MAG: HTTM domain-containing protein [Psychroserpens sp.]|nr:HTTM domain-containing protein [Psychroserpens sp.]